MDFEVTYTEEQQRFRREVRGWLEANVPASVSRTPTSVEDNYRRYLELRDLGRKLGAKGWLGIKLGSKGALLSPTPGEFIDVAVVKPPGPIVDTTGAGDSFIAGILAGVLRGASPAEAGRLGAAAGACCITGLGGSTAIRSYDETAQLAGLKVRL